MLFLRYALSLKCSFTLVNSAFSSIASLEKSNFQKPYSLFFLCETTRQNSEKVVCNQNYSDVLLEKSCEKEFWEGKCVKFMWKLEVADASFRFRGKRPSSFRQELEASLSPLSHHQHLKIPGGEFMLPAEFAQPCTKNVDFVKTQCFEQPGDLRRNVIALVAHKRLFIAVVIF